MRLLTVVLFAGCPGRAWAALTPTDAPGVASGAAPELDEVIVHAPRRKEKIQDAPRAVTAETGRQPEEQPAVAFEDAVREVPNVLAFKSARSVPALEVSMRGQTGIPSSVGYDPAPGRSGQLRENCRL